MSSKQIIACVIIGIVAVNILGGIVVMASDR